jgi:hypothetical protein
MSQPQIAGQMTPAQNYRSAYPIPAEMPGPPQGWAPNAPAAGPTPAAAYTPLDNTARGIRYERSGSSNY